MNKNKIILAAVVVLVLAAAVTAKWLFFPAINDSYFNLNNRNLQQAPAEIVVVRPSHFPRSSRSGIISATVEISGKRAWRMVGRNVSLQQLIATAYGRTQGRVQLPVTAPTNNFDFLVTVRSDQQQHLQKAIRKKLGYIARVENHDTEVLAMKIKNGTLPGFTPSNPDEKSNMNMKNGRLYFTHMQLSVITSGVEQLASLPVIDKTALTNYYNFSVAWGAQVQRQLQDKATARATLEKILNEWGIGLEPETESTEMLVVKNAS